MLVIVAVWVQFLLPCVNGPTDLKSVLNVWMVVLFCRCLRWSSCWCMRKRKWSHWFVHRGRGSVKSLICPEGKSSVCPTLPLLCDCDLHVLSTYLDTLVHILFLWFSNAMSKNESVTFNEFNVWSWWERMNEWYHTNLFLPLISIICGSS